MSVQALSWVFDHSPTKGSDRLVLLAIANHARDNGGVWEAWPSIALIQREAGLSKTQTVRDSLRRLEDRRHITRDLQAAPDARIRADRRSNLYRIVVPDGPPCDGTPSDGSRPPVSRFTAPRETGSKPSLNRQEPKESATVPSHGLPQSVEPAEVEALCAQLQAAVAGHTPGRGQPTVTKSWWREMGMLLNSGARGWDGPVPTASDASAMIADVFDKLHERDRSGFCWADQVRSPQALRRHWPKLAGALDALEPAVQHGPAVVRGAPARSGNPDCGTCDGLGWVDAEEGLAPCSNCWLPL